MPSNTPDRIPKAATDTGNAKSMLEDHLKIICEQTSSPGPEEPTDVIEKKLAASHAVRQILLDQTGTKDAFRQLNGFEALLELLDSIGWPSKDSQSSWLHLLRVVFSVLAAALGDHKGNGSYFRERIAGGGWRSLYLKLNALQHTSLRFGNEASSWLEKHVLGCLFACAIDDETALELFNESQPKAGAEQIASKDAPSQAENTQNSVTARTGSTSASRPGLERVLGASPSLQNPDAIIVAFSLWLDWRDTAEAPKTADNASVVQALLHLAQARTHNLTALHRTSLLSILLSSIVDHKSEIGHMIQIRELAALLLTLGITKLDDARLLYSHARSSLSVAELLLHALQCSRLPSYFHFDLSIYGYSSIELPHLGVSFPPTGASNGYTLSLWFQITNFDSNAHTTLFGAFDSSQTCFVLVYLEKDSRSLIFQTSVKSSRPSVRFKSIAFREGRWYHVVIVHQKPKTTASSRVSLFVNGSFVEQIKANYPMISPVATNKADNTDADPINLKHNPVQTFVGTPQDLASRLGKGVISTEWRLASVHVFSDILSDDLIAVHYELGPRYFGNYQDCLGSFNTYQAAASLKLRNDSLYPSKEQKSDIIRAMETGGSELLPESKVILGLSPAYIFSANVVNTPEQLHGARWISKAATKSLRHLNAKGHDSLVINSAVPAVNQALSHSHGHAVLTGDPVYLASCPLDSAAWQLGGCTAVVLSLLDTATNDDAILCALNCIFEVIRDNWRCSEAMEREHGFTVLSNLIAQKIDRRGRSVEGAAKDPVDQDSKAGFALKVLMVVLKFLGFRTDKAEHSVLNNPLAYRVLVVDADYWRSMPLTVQTLYYEQFAVFGSHSKYRTFNAKRLAKMRIVKRWLEALKTDSFEPTSFGIFKKAFRSLLATNMTGDNLRALAMYITYALERARREDRDSQNQTHNGSVGKSPMSPVQTPNPDLPARIVSSEADSHRELQAEEMAIGMLDMFADLLCVPDETSSIMKFAKTVTNKWLLNLLVSDHPEVIILVSKILGRLLVLNGKSYIKRFSEETGGMIILQNRLQCWWPLPAIWRVCFAILLGCDTSTIEFERQFSLFTLVDDFVANGKCKALHPEVFPVIVALMQSGFKALHGESTSTRDSEGRMINNLGVPLLDSPAENRSGLHPAAKVATPLGNGDSLAAATAHGQANNQPASILGTVIRFLADVHSRSLKFRDFAVSSNYVQELLFTLYPSIVSSDRLDPELELHARESLVAPSKDDVLIRPLSRSSTTSGYVIRSVTAETAPTNLRPRLPTLRRMSSYVLVKSYNQFTQQASSKLQPGLSPECRIEGTSSVDHAVAEELLETIIAVYSDQILVRKDFLGLGLFMKVPPGIQEHQAFFESYILRNTLIHIGNSIRLDPKVVLEPKVLANLQRLAGHLGEAVFEGWFIDGAELVLDFLGGLLEYLELPDVQQTKSIRLCNHIITNIREVFLRISLLRLSEVDELSQPAETVTYMKKLVYWQAVLLATDNSQKHFLRLLCFLLYPKLVAEDDQVERSAASLWRLLLIHKAEETSQILKRAASGHDGELSRGFLRLTEADDETFLAWVGEHRNDLDSMFFDALSKSWAEFVTEENRNTEEAARVRVVKRKDRLRHWSSQALTHSEVIRRHETSRDHWRSNIYSSEFIKKQRSTQDQQNAQAFSQTTWERLKRALERPCGLLEMTAAPRWQLDQTEGRNRMRLRTIIDPNPQLDDYRPKREKSQGPSQKRRDTIRSRRNTVGKGRSPVPSEPKAPESTPHGLPESSERQSSVQPDDDFADDGDDFEMVSDPRGSEDYEDKNRKVLRSLHRDDQVEDVHNVSRIVGLEGSEGLLILGRHHLYLLDGLFQRSDGEIVAVSQAPQDERDSYLQIISGHDPGERPIIGGKIDQDVRSWRRDEILSISRRRFLFRDVAIEVFFKDGRSYLLTTNNTNLRNELYQKLLSKASSASGRGSSTGEDGSWRFDSVQDPADHTQSLGNRFTSVFSQNSSNPATRRWMQGEMSNFNYLMHVNTMAGRTFNDLTQYPVFPWVLADYTSEELDLSDWRSFRDLTKPMGCQTPERQADFRERFQSFAEMGDHNAPPFHYGTHYSTAMIVTSYLIRLQPFVQSYLLLQGGSFDHPDRLFYSVEKTWTSASRGNMTDVRELIPEFFYLPEFLLNTNGFDFGQRQGDGESIDKVALPPWAKGDPKIFIAKHREALESEYVSKHLHHWIDLIFGHKQTGEAALEATNVFHHLSYRGARDLDKIVDPLERVATIGIIHNFGQTPHQIFQRSHPPRDDGKRVPKQLDVMAESLTRLPSAVFAIKDRVTSLHYSARLDRLMCSAPSKINIGPTYDKYMEWGFVDGGIRFYASDTKKLIGLFEHVHVTQISCILFVDSQTLVTAGEDCVISIWGISYAFKSVELQPKGSLFGHRTACTTLAASRSFRTLLSAAEDGQVLLWDLNRLQIVRKLAQGAQSVTCAKINDVNGTIMVCRGQDLTLFTLNGEALVDQNVCTEDDRVVSCAFYEGSGNDWLKRELVFTGHRRGVVNIWNVAIRGGAFVLEHVKRMHHLDQAGYNIQASISCVLPLAQRVYTGDEEGRVYEWQCVQRQ